MTFQLRPYQQALLKQTQDALAADAKGRVMLQLPTGGGKTVIAGALLADWLQDGRKAVWLTHRKELAEQTRRMLTDAGVSARTDFAWTPKQGVPDIPCGVVILMAQKVSFHNKGESRVWNRYGANDLLVIDEAHHASAPGWERAMQQWPGPIVGMTATPWRLSEKEGFDHLFSGLLCGPQTADLQSLGSLCDAQVFIPPPEQRIAGGAVDRTGDYNERGIEQANRDRPDIMTAGALAFWQKHADKRQTIAYAVSVDHAHNLAAVFNDAGIPAAVILGDTNREERDRAISGFRDGSIRVLVNVIVATEGFDLPDASCVIIARPTMSLALYLQMVGRGLRPKPDGGDCLILDLAANAVTHGLPEDYREWSLEPRGTQKSGEAPVVMCPLCEAASHAASHNCRICGFSFGKDCERCGRWRSRKRWLYEKHCGDAHQHVCDLCHIDAHIQAHLPVAPPLDELVELYDPEDEMTFPTDVEIDDDLANRLSVLFRELLESERQSIVGADDARREELRGLIEEREAVLNDEGELVQQFDEYIATLSPRPNRIRELQMYGDWEGTLKAELASWRDEVNALESREVDKQAIFDSARNKAMHLLRRAAEGVELLPDHAGGNEALSATHFGQQPALGNSSPSTLHTPTNSAVLPVTLVPAPEASFKDALMRTKQAWIVTTYQDGREDVSLWRANNITPSSNIVGNIRSRPQFRSGTWQAHGIRSVRVSIDHPETAQPPESEGTQNSVVPANQISGGAAQISISDLRGMKSMADLKPKSISFPDGTKESITDWRRLYVTVADWLIDSGRLSQQNIPNKVQSHFSDEQVQFDSGAFKSRKLKNGMWLNTNFSAPQTMSRIGQLLEAFGENPAQFQVQLR